MLVDLPTEMGFSCSKYNYCVGFTAKMITQQKNEPVQSRLCFSFWGKGNEFI
jgi:hypothetical protein